MHNCSMAELMRFIFLKCGIFQLIMSSKNYLEKAIQLVSVNSFGKLMLHAEGVDFLRSLNAPVAVATITGPVKTGKSFLMNQLISKQDAFEVGHNHTPVTKGLWLWSKPVLAYNDKGKIVSVVLVDSEGFSRPAQTPDRRISTLILLFSSCIVYNSMGAINKQSLFDLQELLRVVRAFPVQQNVAFSDFQWIVRDYNANLVNEFGIGISPKQYMENCLLQITEKQLLGTVQTIKAYFPTRGCHCLLQPNDGQGEQHPKFMEHVIELRKIFNGIRSFDLDGHSLAVILQSYVDVLNNEGSSQKVYEQGQDCRTRLNCLQKLNEELKGLERKQSLNQLEDIDEKLYDIRTHWKEHYKQRMCSYRQIKMLDDEINETLQDFREMIELRPGMNSYKETGGSKSIVRMAVQRQDKMTRASLNMQEMDRQLLSSKEVRAPVSINRINTSKNLHSKLQQYQAKVYRYELQAGCSKKQIQTLKVQYDNSKRALEEKQDEVETLIMGFNTKEKILDGRIFGLEEDLVQLQKQKMLADSEIQKISMLTSEKIDNLEGQLRDMAASTAKERGEREAAYKSKLTEYLNEIEELKHSHEEEIVQLKSIYTSSHQKSTDSSAVKATENFYESMREQMEVIEKLKEENDKTRYSKLQLEDSLKILRSRLENREDYFKESLEQQVKRSREAEKHIQSVCETKLTSKDKIIEELQGRIVELTRGKQEREIKDDRLIRAKDTEVVELRGEISKRTAAIQRLNIEKEEVKKKIEQVEQQLSERDLHIKRYVEKTKLLEIDLRKIREENDGLKSVSQKNKSSLELTIAQHQSLLSETQTQLQGERHQRQFQAKRHENQLGEIRGMFEADKLRLQQRIDQLNEMIEGYRRMQMQFEDLQHESTETQFELREMLDDREKELERLKVQHANARKQSEHLKVHASESMESMVAQKQEMLIGYEQTVKELKREMQQEQKKYDTILHTLGCKEKQLYMMTENGQKDRRAWSYRQEEYKTTINELTKISKEREELSRKESERLKSELSKARRQNIELQNKIALLTQKILFLEQSIAAKTQGRKSEQTKIAEKTNKMQERHVESIRTKDGQIESLKSLIAICMKEKQIAIQNIGEMQHKFKGDQRRCEAHLNLFQRKLEQVKQQNRQLTQTLQQYRSDYQHLKQLKENTEHNYNRDSQLWHGKLSICEQKILGLKAAK